MSLRSELAALAPSRGNVLDFDAWHAAMMGEETHEQMRQQRLNSIVNRQVDDGLTYMALAAVMLDPSRLPTHVVTLNAAGDIVAIERL